MTLQDEGRTRALWKGTGWNNITVTVTVTVTVFADVYQFQNDG